MDKGTYRHGHRKEGIHEIMIWSHSAGALLVMAQCIIGLAKEGILAAFIALLFRAFQHRFA